MRIAVPSMALSLALLAGCGEQPIAPGQSAGERLERAARAAGLVADARRTRAIGMFASETDRVCIVPGESTRRRIGVSVDDGDGQRCLAHGTARGASSIVIDLGGNCRFAAQLDGERLRFPAVLPAACDRACTGRASLTALSATRLSEAVGEARRARDVDGKLLCAG